MLKQSHIHLLIEHLRQLKRDGVTQVNYEDSSLDALYEAALRAHKTMPDPIFPDLVTPPQVGLPPVPDKAFLFNVLRAQIQTNQTIAKHVHPGCQFVLGRGNLNAPICIVGEAPGSEEEKAGLPFVGPAGKLLTKFLSEVGLDDSYVFITNIMLWRPEMETTTGNRPPTTQEMNFCLPYCKAQLDIVKPACIIALGSTAVNGLLGVNKQRRITQIRGTWDTYNNIPLIPTYHPSYLLRSGSKELNHQFITDLISAKQKARLPIHPHETSLYT